MSSIIRSRNGDMVVSFRSCTDGKPRARRIERIHRPANYPDRTIQLPSAEPFRPTFANGFGPPDLHRWVHRHPRAPLRQPLNGHSASRGSPYGLPAQASRPASQCSATIDRRMDHQRGHSNLGEPGDILTLR